jgi:hypothetical protein
VSPNSRTIATEARIAGMLYPVHIAANRHDPLPPVAELTTIEADSPQEALEKPERNPLP